LVETYLDKAEDLPHLGKQFVPAMMDPVLKDYARNVPDARESEVLSLFATIITSKSIVSLVHPFWFVISFKFRHSFSFLTALVYPTLILQRLCN
jgi:hypothetical protein